MNLLRCGTTNLFDRLVDPPLGDEHECRGEYALQKLWSETGVEACGVSGASSVTRDVDRHAMFKLSENEQISSIGMSPDGERSCGHVGAVEMIRGV